MLLPNAEVNLVAAGQAAGNYRFSHVLTLTILSGGRHLEEVKTYWNSRTTMRALSAWCVLLVVCSLMAFGSALTSPGYFGKKK
ncbi:hypothetical protein GCK32_002457 [Trichostrongylus colubriformis]|uniref:Uncharacterized protein n=1 Tax=Trichostrongylus colubriformis TaxID=6319 RepID=A0AAN8FBY0_TRICO